jgi:hypothetical protein
MTDATRRLFLRAFAVSAGGLAKSWSLAVGNDVKAPDW